jgi:hypothetical protein
MSCGPYPIVPLSLTRVSKTAGSRTNVSQVMSSSKDDGGLACASARAGVFLCGSPQSLVRDKL